MISPATLTFRQIIIFWLPLAATWFMMSVEGPFIAAIIARLADPKINLAAYGVAFSFSGLMEAPIIMIMSASVVLVKDKASYYKLRNFIFGLNLIITVFMLFSLITPLFFWITTRLVDLPADIARLTCSSALIMIFWPRAIGYRRFYHGLLIQNKLTRLVAYGTILRLLTMAFTAYILFRMNKMQGAYVAQWRYHPR